MTFKLYLNQRACQILDRKVFNQILRPRVHSVVFNSHIHYPKTRVDRFRILSGNM